MQATTTTKMLSLFAFPTNTLSLSIYLLFFYTKKSTLKFSTVSTPKSSKKKLANRRYVYVYFKIEVEILQNFKTLTKKNLIGCSCFLGD